MARASSKIDPAARPAKSPPGEWQALRGELVALLDQVEGRYVAVEQPDPAFEGLAQRVRSLRGQVAAPQPVTARQDALKSVKRAVDRFSERDEAGGDNDALTMAIAEIRGRQMSAPAAALSRQANDMPEFRELSGLVGGLTNRLARMGGELKARSDGDGGVKEVSSQV